MSVVSLDVGIVVKVRVSQLTTESVVCVHSVRIDRERKKKNKKLPVHAWHEISRRRARTIMGCFIYVTDELAAAHLSGTRARTRNGSVYAIRSFV
jgi:hypothetical protein